MLSLLGAKRRRRPSLCFLHLGGEAGVQLVGRPELAEVLWAKTREPLRAALLASMVCKRLSRQDELRAYQEDLQKQSHSFERLALELLDGHESVPAAVKAVANAFASQ